MALIYGIFELGHRQGRMEEEEKGKGRKSLDARQGKEEGAVVCGMLLLFTRDPFFVQGHGSLSS